MNIRSSDQTKGQPEALGVRNGGHWIAQSHEYYTSASTKRARIFVGKPITHGYLRRSPSQSRGENWVRIPGEEIDGCRLFLASAYYSQALAIRPFRPNPFLSIQPKELFEATKPISELVFVQMHGLREPASPLQCQVTLSLFNGPGIVAQAQNISSRSQG